VSQALDAWELGHHISDLSSPYYYEELGLYRLLAGLRARDELRRFYDETLGPLVRYDHAHGTDLTHTLEVFFEQNANASQTSRALYVHRNTLNYRLQRIAEISGLDLDQAEARLAFQLALKFHHLLQ
jgi:purine catabolism regulator